MSYASDNGHLPVCEFLVGAGAKVDHAIDIYKIWDGSTPLSRASGKGHLPVCEFLVGAGAKVDHADEYGCTPLSCASYNGHLPVCEFLVGAGAKVDHAAKVRIMTLYTLYIANTI